MGGGLQPERVCLEEACIQGRSQVQGKHFEPLSSFSSCSALLGLCLCMRVWGGERLGEPLGRAGGLSRHLHTS